ncbi:MAG: response regulator [Anaerolineales bacterium]
MQATPIEILMVEDNPGDVRLTKEAFKENKIQNNMYVAEDGELALDYLHQRNGYEDAVRPDLILLDLNLPKLDGRQVLQDIKEDPDLKRIPVVILTTSEASEDIVRTYDLHANSYVTKPVDFDQFCKVVHSIEEFWFTVVKLPQE